MDEFFQSVKQQFPERYGDLEGQALYRAIHQDFYAPGSTGFIDKDGNQQGGISEGDPGWTYEDLIEKVGTINPEDPTDRSRMSDYVISGLVGGGMGFLMGGPPGAAIGFASGIAGTATDHGLSLIDMNDDGVPDVPGYVRFPLSMAAGGGVSKVGGRVANRAFGVLQEGAEQYLDDAARLNVSPRAGDIDDAARVLENRLVAQGSVPATQQATNQATQLRTAATQFADDIAPNIANQRPDRVVADMLEAGYRQAKQQSGALFDDAAQAASGAKIPLNETSTRVTQVLRELEALGTPGGTVTDIAKQIQAAIKAGKPIPYETMRIWQKGFNEIIDRPLAATGAMDGRAKFLLGGIMDDLDQWGTSEAGLKAGGQAHNAAMEFFRNRVAPYRVDPKIFEAATGGPKGADKLIESVVGYGGRGRPDQVQRLMDLLPQAGRDAVARDVAQNAAHVSGAGFANTAFSPSQLFNRLNVGTTARPQAGTLAFRNTPGALEDAQALSRMTQMAGRSNLNRLPSPTGKFNLPSISSGGAAMGGGGVGYAVGGGDVMTTLAGMAAGPAIRQGLLNTAGRVVSSNPYIQYSMGQPMFRGGGVGQYVPGLTGTVAPGLLELWRERNRNIGNR